MREGRDPVQTWCYEVDFCLRTMNNIFFILIRNVHRIERVQMKYY